MPADMYVLAMMAQTKKGGGTSVENTTRAASKIVKQSGRTIKNFSSKISIRQIKRYTDDGLPLIWVMTVEPALNRRLSARADVRKNVTDWDVWNEELRKIRRDARKIAKPRDNAHVCMITGYNPITSELAISDSWGKQFEERWITVEEAQAISLGRLIAISW